MPKPYYNRSYTGYRPGFAKRTYGPPVEKFASPQAAGLATQSESDEIVKYLTVYNDTFPLLVDFRDKVYAGQGLSSKQWQVVVNSYTTSKATAKTSGTIFPIKFSVPVDIVIDKGTANRHFRVNLKLKYAVFTLRVHEIVAAKVTRSGPIQYQLKVTPNVDGPVSVCRMCGRNLTDHKSIKTGVGPFCVKRLGPAAIEAYKSDPTKFMTEFKNEVGKLGETTIEVWNTRLDSGGRFQIDTEFADAESTVVQTTPIPVVPQVKSLPVYISHLAWNEKSKSLEIISVIKSLFTDINTIRDAIYNKDYVDILVKNPATGNDRGFKFLHVKDQRAVYHPVDLDVDCTLIIHL